MDDVVNRAIGLAVFAKEVAEARRNPHCSNCGDTRGGPVRHEAHECTWKQTNARSRRP